MLSLFGFGPLIYGESAGTAPHEHDSLVRRQNTQVTDTVLLHLASCLLLNAVAILSEDRFLARSTSLLAPRLPSILVQGRKRHKY